MANLVDIFLNVAFRFTGSRKISETINTRRMAARYAARKARVIAEGGYVVTIKGIDGERDYFVEAGGLCAFFGREA